MLRVRSLWEGVTFFQRSFRESAAGAAGFGGGAGGVSALATATLSGNEAWAASGSLWVTAVRVAAWTPGGYQLSTSDWLSFRLGPSGAAGLALLWTTGSGSG